MTTLNEIEKKALAYSQAREAVATIVSAMHEGIEAIKRDHLPELRKAVGKAAEKHDVLKALLEKAPELFEKPRTKVFHGVKVGYQKGKGGIEIFDADKTIALIEKHLSSKADVLITTTKKPAKDAIASLEASDLKRIGCNIVATTDSIVIKPTDSEVDKLVNALLDDATEEREAA